MFEIMFLIKEHFLNPKKILSIEQVIFLTKIYKRHKKNCKNKNCLCKKNSKENILQFYKSEEIENFQTRHINVNLLTMIGEEQLLTMINSIKITQSQRNDLIPTYIYFCIFFLGNFSLASKNILLLKESKIRYEMTKNIFTYGTHLSNLKPTSNFLFLSKYDKKFNAISLTSNKKFFEVIKFISSFKKLKKKFDKALEIKNDFFTSIYTILKFKKVFKFTKDYRKIKDEIEEDYEKNIIVGEGRKYPGFSLLMYQYYNLFNYERKKLVRYLRSYLNFQKIKDFYTLFQMDSNKIDVKNIFILKVDFSSEKFQNISFVSSNTELFLGFDRKDLIKKDLGDLIPEPAREGHYSLKDSLNLSKNVRMGKQGKMLFMYNKRKLIKPIYIDLRVFPSLKNGIQYISFISTPYKIPLYKIPNIDYKIFIIPDNKGFIRSLSCKNNFFVEGQSLNNLNFDLSKIFFDFNFVVKEKIEKKNLFKFQNKIKDETSYKRWIQYIKFKLGFGIKLLGENQKIKKYWVQATDTVYSATGHFYTTLILEEITQNKPETDFKKNFSVLNKEEKKFYEIYVENLRLCKNNNNLELLNDSINISSKDNIDEKNYEDFLENNFEELDEKYKSKSFTNLKDLNKNIKKNSLKSSEINEKKNNNKKSKIFKFNNFPKIVETDKRMENDCINNIEEKEKREGEHAVNKVIDNREENIDFDRIEESDLNKDLSISGKSNNVKKDLESLFSSQFNSPKKCISESNENSLNINSLAKKPKNINRRNFEKKTIKNPKKTKNEKKENDSYLKRIQFDTESQNDNNSLKNSDSDSDSLKLQIKTKNKQVPSSSFGNELRKERVEGNNKKFQITDNESMMSYKMIKNQILEKYNIKIQEITKKGRSYSLSHFMIWILSFFYIIFFTLSIIILIGEKRLVKEYFNTIELTIEYNWQIAIPIISIQTENVYKIINNGIIDKDFGKEKYNVPNYFQMTKNWIGLTGPVLFPNKTFEVDILFKKKPLKYLSMYDEWVEKNIEVLVPDTPLDSKNVELKKVTMSQIQVPKYATGYIRTIIKRDYENNTYPEEKTGLFTKENAEKDPITHLLRDIYLNNYSLWNIDFFFKICKATKRRFDIMNLLIKIYLYVPVGLFIAAVLTILIKNYFVTRAMIKFYEKIFYREKKIYYKILQNWKNILNIRKKVDLSEKITEDFFKIQCTQIAAVDLETDQMKENKLKKNNKGNRRQKTYNNEMMKRSEKNSFTFGLSRIRYIFILATLLNVGYLFYIYSRMNSKIDIIKNNMKATEHFTKTWFLSFGGHSILTNMIAWNSTYVYDNRITPIQTIEGFIDIIRNDLIPEFEKYPNKNFGKFTEQYRSFATDMNICESLMGQFNVKCDLALNGFCKGNVILFLNGLVTIFKDLIRSYEQLKDTEEGLASILSSPIMKDIYIYGRFTNAGMYLNMVQDMLFYMFYLLEDLYNPMITRFIIDMIYQIFLILMVLFFIVRNANQIFRDYFLIFKMFPGEFWESNLKLRNFFEKNKDEDLTY